MKLIIDENKIGPVSTHIKDITLAWLNKKDLILTKEGQVYNRSKDNSTNFTPPNGNNVESNFPKGTNIKPNFGTDVNTPSEKSRYSITADEDAVYLDAVRRGDMETAQRMVDEAARLAGYTIEAYHGSRSKFTVFDKNKGGQSNSEARLGFWFTNI